MVEWLFNLHVAAVAGDAPAFEVWRKEIWWLHIFNLQPSLIFFP